MDVFDSRRNFSKESRTATIHTVSDWLKAVWKLPVRKSIKVVLKEKGVLAQTSDDGDSAIFAVNHAIMAFGAKTPSHDRRSLRQLVRERGDK